MILPTDEVSSGPTLFVLWAGEVASLRRFIRQVSHQSVVVIVRLPGADWREMVAACGAVAKMLGAASAAGRVRVGLNVGGAERGCAPNDLLSHLADSDAGLPAWLQLPERAEPLTHFTAPGTRLLRSCHDLAGVEVALAAGAHACTLSPIWPTRSKPGDPGLGEGRLASACARWPRTIVALGGVNAERARRSLALGAAGVAVRSGAWCRDVRPLLAAFDRGAAAGDDSTRGGRNGRFD